MTYKITFGTTIYGDVLFRDIILPPKISNYIIIITSTYDYHNNIGESIVFKLKLDNYYVNFTNKNIIEKVNHYSYDFLENYHKYLLDKYSNKYKKEKSKIYIEY